MELRGQPVQVFVAPQGDGIRRGGVPTILLKGRDQWPVADVLGLPKHDGKWKRRNQVEQLKDSLDDRGIGRIRGEVRRRDCAE